MRRGEEGGHIVRDNVQHAHLCIQDTEGHRVTATRGVAELNGSACMAVITPTRVINPSPHLRSASLAKYEQLVADLSPHTSCTSSPHLLSPTSPSPPTHTIWLKMSTRWPVSLSLRSSLSRSTILPLVRIRRSTTLQGGEVMT